MFRKCFVSVGCVCVRSHIGSSHFGPRRSLSLPRHSCRSHLGIYFGAASSLGTVADTRTWVFTSGRLRIVLQSEFPRHRCRYSQLGIYFRAATSLGTGADTRSWVFISRRRVPSALLPILAVGYLLQGGGFPRHCCRYSQGLRCFRAGSLGTVADTRKVFVGQWRRSDHGSPLVIFVLLVGVATRAGLANRNQSETESNL